MLGSQEWTLAVALTPVIVLSFTLFNFLSIPIMHLNAKLSWSCPLSLSERESAIGYSTYFALFYCNGGGRPSLNKL